MPSQIPLGDLLIRMSLLSMALLLLLPRLLSRWSMLLVGILVRGDGHMKWPLRLRSCTSYLAVLTGIPESDQVDRGFPNCSR